MCKVEELHSPYLGLSSLQVRVPELSGAMHRTQYGKLINFIAPFSFYFILRMCMDFGYLNRVG